MNWQDDPAFVAAVKIVITHEGGYTCHPRKAGNWTGGARLAPPGTRSRFRIVFPRLFQP